MIMKKITSIEEIMEILESGEYNYYGIRAASQNDMKRIEDGKNYLECSHNWIDNEITDELLNGTCAIGIYDSDTAKQIAKAIERTKIYPHETGVILLIADKNMEYGEDDGEVILGNDGYGADVIGIIEL